MSNPLRSSSLDAQTTEPAADDLDEPPPPPSRGRTLFNNGPSPAAGRRGGQFTLSRRHSQQLSAQRRSQINQHQQGHSGDSSSTVYEELSGLAPPPGNNNIQEESGVVIIHPSSPNPHSQHQHQHHHPSPITHDHHPQSRWQQQQPQHHPQESQPNGRQEATTVIFYDTQPYIQPQHQNHSHPNPPQQQLHHHQHFSFTSPPESHQSASLTSSTSDSSSFLRHPHDPRLLQAQYQATASSFDLPPDPNFTPNASDLVPIQLQGSVTAHTHIPQPQPPPFVGFPVPGPAGPAAAPFIHAGDDSDFFHPHPHPHHHPHHHHHRQNGVLQFPGGYPISFMQNPELSILNAESFDDGVPGFHAPRSLPPAGRARVAGEDSGKSRKRTKMQAVDTCEQEEEEKKRSRGRPRLDTNDETAKDRRRTQIRLAQRAYRNRKETAIQTLEKKVDQLRSNNEEMSKAFMKLYDFAVGKGMLDTAPEFGKQLQATTEKFYSLARRTSEDGGKDVDMATAPDHESEGHRSSPNSNPDKPNERSPSPDRAQPETQPDQVLYGGYMVDHTSMAHHPHHHSHALTAVHTTSWAHNNQALQARTITSQAPLGYEIVTEPTPDNASFPFGMSLEGSGLDTAGLLDSSGQPLSFSESPYSLLSAPSSYAYQERTFGRRLQRSTLERAYILMRMPNPPPNRIASVFGFCMLFETREKIVERLANRLSVNQRETLFNWRFPFLHLGGGGTFFDEMRNEMDASDLPRHDKSLRTTQTQVGNQGSLEPERQKIDSMYGIGPWNAQTEEIRDARVDHKLRMSVPGFDGDFYDADEVEWSLRQRGVVIPPAADFVTADINPADFTDEAIAERSFNPLVDNYIATTMAESNFNMAAPFGDNTPSQSTGQPVNLEATGTPTLEFMGTTAQGVPSTVSMENPMSLDPTLGGDLFGLGASTPSQVPTPASTRRTVTINVGMLVHELGSRSVCLGRSPGIRPKDVNAAFWSSLAA
ncbi:hypothetical protein CGCS363_v013863 [Colletotrichum siamense]|uniref:uncharacterized protein n=1 Tax=Colletotrichum siamense TaxID=690259 RepID=UPI0018733A8A|nr:uncharacterized protein CGCS363_v013863 [Colletotrichum siamense]KAF5487213.1 hypothetical protein CGCS363_v013863 [Colletotrichum siamense]